MKRRSLLRPVLAAAALAATVMLGGCDSFTQVYQRGYVLPEGALEQVPLGAPQGAEQKLAFLPQAVTNQRVIAVYFDKQRRVERLANYGLKDGRVFDFVARTTPSGGTELNYLNYIFSITKPIGT